MKRVQCPCCKYLTLENKGEFEICILCDWEDDGQDDPYADEIFGGPNGEYSLTQGRKNFQSHGFMYDTMEKNPSVKEKHIRKLLMSAFEKLSPDQSSNNEEIWREIKHYENFLLNERGI
ncbi:CPCC family cysteine-rich protein [Priestia aryabhattai]|uniref:CPCC family cysteine-rich protein n=1 Tax=Priestia aryabhattai TaxID=412384 RepID=UPI0015947957|nr:CPCC family cysteine-rich protein [Priestia aryabhattai]WKG29213.1 CPCC family cysteine-rich protein [Priestia aryabhattai]